MTRQREEARERGGVAEAGGVEAVSYCIDDDNSETTLAFVYI